VAAAIARVKAKKAAQAQLESEPVKSESEAPEEDPRKAAVAAAIARVKAKKAAQSASAVKP
ncbi:electron transporter RnfC, partial [Yersinia enterocolitica]